MRYVQMKASLKEEKAGHLSLLSIKMWGVVCHNPEVTKAVLQSLAGQATTVLRKAVSGMMAVSWWS